MEEKTAVIAIATRTPKPIYWAIGIILLTFMLTLTGINVLGCTDLQDSDSLLKSIFSLRAECRYSPNLSGWQVAIGSLLVGGLLSFLVVKACLWLFEDSKDDALSGVRKKLIGAWHVEAIGDDDNPWTGTAEFEIEEEFRKLLLIIKIPSRPPYEPLILNTYDIVINPRRDPMRITYFVDETFQLTNGGSVARSVVVRLSWVVSHDKDMLQGSWHDLLPPDNSKRTAGRITFERDRTIQTA
jgi:hypothetical protein